MPAGAVCIPFIDNYEISFKSIKENCLDRELLAGISTPTIKFIEYKNHQLALNSLFPTNEYEVKFKAIDNGLQAMCSCKDKRPGICLHIYKTLEAIAERYGRNYFAQLVKNNQFDLAFKYPTSFDKEENDRGICIKKRKEVMQLFPFENSTYPIPLDKILSLKTPPEVMMPEKRESIAFLIMLPHSARQLPFLLPAIGKLAVSNDKVLSWIKFLLVVESDTEKLMNVHQLDLVNKAYQLRDRSEALANVTDYFSKPNWNQQTEVIYNDWKKVFAILQSEVFIYTHKYFGYRILRRRPSKADVSKIAVCMESPVIYFKLTYTKERFQLELGIKLNGKPLSGFNINHPFFVIHQGKMYMYSTYQDAAVVQWIYQIGHISFFKEHKKDFSESILNPLSEHYSIL